MGQPILYSYYRSSASFRARIGLSLKSIEYEYRAVHLLKDGGKQNESAYREVNPISQVPTFVHDGFVLSQSMAILEYLDEVFPAKPLFPVEPKARAKVRQMCEVINSGIQPLQNISVVQELGKRFQASEQAKSQWMIYWIEKGMQAFEMLLQQHGGTYCWGGQVTAADAFLVPQVFSAKRFQVDMARFPLASSIYERCMVLPAFQKAQPSAQPDAEG